MSNRLWWATLREGSSNYEDWKLILGTDDVPLKSPSSVFADLGSEGEVEIYELDLDKLDAGQFRRLVQWIQTKFAEPPDSIALELCASGFPIRAADVIVAFNMRAFI